MTLKPVKVAVRLVAYNFPPTNVQRADIWIWEDDTWWMLADSSGIPYYLAVELAQIMEYELGCPAKVKLSKEQPKHVFYKYN